MLLRSRCPHCARPFDRFDRCRRKSCPGFNPIWAGDWLKVYLRNLELLEDLVLVTITAPGVADGLPWDENECKLPKGHRHSGPDGCRVVHAAAQSWNRTAPARFSALHRRAAARTVRKFGPGPLIAAKGLEYQQRGVLHFHVVIDWSFRQRERSAFYVDQLRELAPAEMFGSVDVSQRDPKKRGERVAFYLSKYVGKAAAEMAQLRRPAFVGRHLTERSNVTMRAARLRRWCWVVVKANRLENGGEDFVDYLWERLVDGEARGALLRSLNLSLPPPPSPALAGSACDPATPTARP